MSAPYYSLFDKASEAMAAWIISQVPTAIVYSAKRALDDDDGDVICHAESATPQVQWSGRWVIDMRVDVYYVAASDAPTSSDGSATAVAASSDLVANVFDALNYGDHGDGRQFADALSALVDDFTCHQVMQESMSQDQDGNLWKDSMHLKMVCSPSDIA